VRVGLAKTAHKDALRATARYLDPSVHLAPEQPRLEYASSLRKPGFLGEKSRLLRTLERGSNPDYPATDMGHIAAKGGATDSPIGSARFTTTRRSLIPPSAHPQAPGNVEAVARFYRDYWCPLGAYLRRRGRSPHEAEDLAQGFSLSLLEHRCWRGLERGPPRNSATASPSPPADNQPCNVADPMLWNEVE